MADDKEDVHEATHSQDVERSITLGLSAASFAGILAAYAGPSFDGYAYYATVCFCIVMPVTLTVFFIVHPASKELQLADYAPQVTAGSVIICALLTVIGFGLLVAHLAWGLGVFFVAWSVVAPVVIVLSCVAVRAIIEMARSSK
ncbi:MULTISPECIES: hypothetical protein [unclassified Mesorhizobium]|uniref:hypothetical protein n=1 Tax=unclassified Mesorhizobium TaxID=325217 RepID=UPI003338C470